MIAITANRLADGAAVWLQQDKSWATNFEALLLFKAQEDAEPTLNWARSQYLVVVNPYAIETEANLPAGQKTIRETIRLNGPSAGSTLSL